ncbi:MAG: germination protein YpeB [Christensenellales bacterium]|jgi:spore germination protein
MNDNKNGNIVELRENVRDKKKVTLKSNKWFITAVALVVLLTASTAYAASQSHRADMLTTARNQQYQRSFEQLAGDIEKLKNDLAKLRAVSGTEQASVLIMSIWRSSGDAAGAAGNLPASLEVSGRLTRFLNQLGDFCRSLGRRVAYGEMPSSEDMEQLDALSAEVENLYTQINEMKSSDIFTNLEEVEYLSDEVGNYAGIDKSAGEEFPTIIYDGPFSDSTEKLEPQGLCGEELTKEQALEKAKEYTGIENFEADSDEKGKIYAYGYKGWDENGHEVRVLITKQGGSMLSMTENVPIMENVIADEALKDKSYETAGAYLEKIGYTGMKANYWQHYDGVAVINFTYTQDDIVIYPDIIKVWVELRTQKIVGIDARNYLMAHKERQLESPEISLEDAQQRVSQRLDVRSSQLALIPLEDNSELLCYEFQCRLGEDDFLVYIDANTGAEQNILRIIHAENGELTA